MSDLSAFYGTFVDPSTPSFSHYPRGLREWCPNGGTITLDGPCDLKRFAARIAQEVGKHLSGAISHLPALDYVPAPGFVAPSDRFRNRLSHLCREITRSSLLFRQSRVFSRLPILGTVYTDYWNAVVVPFAQELFCDIAAELGYVFGPREIYFPFLAFRCDYDHFNSQRISYLDSRDLLEEDSIILGYGGTYPPHLDYVYLHNVRHLFEPDSLSEGEAHDWFYHAPDAPTSSISTRGELCEFSFFV